MKTIRLSLIDLADKHRQERKERKKQKELEIALKGIDKMDDPEKVALEVELYQNRIELLKSVHMECGLNWDWEKIKSTEPPAKPKKSNKNKKIAQKQVDNYKPGLVQKIFKKPSSKQTDLFVLLNNAKIKDEDKYQNDLKTYEMEYSEWEHTSGVASKILQKDYLFYRNTIRGVNPFEEMKDFGSSLIYNIESQEIIDVEFYVNSDISIPKDEKISDENGELLQKAMHLKQFYELYQDYVCGCVFRIARELYAFLPIKTVIVNVFGNHLNLQTGHMEEGLILSIELHKPEIEKINFKKFNPKESVQDFTHNMDFQKTMGFKSVDQIGEGDSIRFSDS